PVENYPVNPFEYTRRHTVEIVNFGGHQVPRVIADFSGREKITPASLFAVGYNYSIQLDKWNINDMACDYLYAGKTIVDFAVPGTLGVINDHHVWQALADRERRYPLISAAEFLQGVEPSSVLNFVSVSFASLSQELISRLKDTHRHVLIIETNNDHGMAEQRRLFVELLIRRCEVPVVIRREYKNLTAEQLQLWAATDAGALLIDGLGDGILLSAENCGGDKLVNETAFNILQATRTRISKTEYISCPSCGRTLFDLQETTAKIRARTYHLKGIKIGIMGCIVNGPGEMADADYGYVGSGPGRITLYRGKEVVKRNVPTANAVDALIDLIREDGSWIEPPLVEK
ncbi:MAG TPA: flavodoxin-dependent (E)-4-hydroxy-3-methylbut-2-enyl-diphosphate synthase, partial [Chryseosolibacter sp.]|nr:flavodoxin-dependent (E)-4-hydroxy-3-methylbut-2-enyl-diphosphate synthase [Chryseosolibacter sp.]